MCSKPALPCLIYLMRVSKPWELKQRIVASYILLSFHISWYLSGRLRTSYNRYAASLLLVAVACVLAHIYIYIYIHMQS